MIGAIAGDIIGSIYEFDNIKTTKFELFQDTCIFTDDTVLTVALAESILTGRSYESLMREYYRRYPDAGYGRHFRKWATGEYKGAYGSCGNGSAMRISPVGWAYQSLDEVLQKAEESTSITHNHPEGIKGAQATASAIFMARSGSSKDDIRKYVTNTFGYNLTMTCDDIRPAYTFDGTCQGTVPQALVAFLDSSDFESAIRLAVSLGGDTDTLACITGGIAEAFYGVPECISDKVYQYLDEPLSNIVNEFVCKFGIANKLHTN